MQQLLQNPWVGFTGTLLGIVGVALSILFYLRSRRFQRPTFAKRSIRWFDGSIAPHSEIRMFFRDQEIQRFTITHLAFWNAGNQTIRKNDFAVASPLRLHIPPEITVFDIRVTATTAAENGVVLDGADFPTRAQADIAINFDFFDAEDGFVVQIVHDGDSAKEIGFDGKLPGVHSFLRVRAELAFRLSRPLISGSQSTPFLRTPWYVKYLLIPFTFLSLSSIGVISLYCMIWLDFHWYQPLGLIFLVYLLFPIVMFERELPSALADAIQNSNKSTI